jgi:hypothetical protein
MSTRENAAVLAPEGEGVFITAIYFWADLCGTDVAACFARFLYMGYESGKIRGSYAAIGSFSSP